ncbi:hypothetical protein EG68_00065 [Paragonimus skrjabini miyazakii]|uniref:Reverse transcriptase domain-containing protein n=1 Tax=Paragonimus skrjabini miyazakii TaxID=59628 RepID=A0A8S9ZB02_9TREM|nr:hypothetical protein EG68_00065 [Paragonimus skrjabini miyazakii]
MGGVELLTGNECVRAPQSSEFQYLCGGVFKSKRGLGQHKRHKHPAILNVERLAVLPRRKGEWSEYDTRKLVNLANALMGSVSSKAALYQKLAAMFPGRSAEGVKKRLIKVKWSGISKHGVQRDVSQPKDAIRDDDDDVTVIDVEQLEEESWRSTMHDNIIDSLTKFNEPRIRSTDLLAIARKLKFGRMTYDAARFELETIVAECFPVKWKFQVRKTRVFWKALSKRMIRRLNYAAIQRLYHTRRKDAANSVLDGSWASMYRRELIYPINMKDYWKEIFEMRSKRDNRPVAQKGHEWDVVAALGSEEVRNALRDAAGTAPGVDKLLANEVLKWNLEAVAQLFNLMLVFETPTSRLSLARLTFVAKVDEPATPADYRPIAVSSVLQRVMHKVLAKRVRDRVTFSSLQVAFQKKDGCLEASTLLHTILRTVHDEGKSIAVAFLDISKAFDSVSHDTLLRNARRYGLPPPCVLYLTRLYNDSLTRWDDATIKCCPGVRQGDPLSPSLFIIVMDEVLSYAKPQVGFMLNGKCTGELAYADDLVLFANSQSDLIDKLEGRDEGLRLTGKKLNNSKCRTLTIVKDRKRKHLVLFPCEY